MARYSKAIYAGLVAAQTAFIAGALPGSEGGSGLTANEITLTVFATLVAAAGTFAIPNK